MCSVVYFKLIGWQDQCKSTFQNVVINSDNNKEYTHKLYCCVKIIYMAHNASKWIPRDRLDSKQVTSECWTKSKLKMIRMFSCGQLGMFCLSSNKYIRFSGECILAMLKTFKDIPWNDNCVSPFSIKTSHTHLNTDSENEPINLCKSVKTKRISIYSPTTTTTKNRKGFVQLRFHII